MSLLARLGRFLSACISAGIVLFVGLTFYAYAEEPRGLSTVGKQRAAQASSRM
jgi:hypothetical protein